MQLGVERFTPCREMLNVPDVRRGYSSRQTGPRVVMRETEMETINCKVLC